MSVNFDNVNAPGKLPQLFFFLKSTSNIIEDRDS